MQTCYSCRHYRRQTERIIQREANGKKAQPKDVQVERCAARNNRELLIPVIDESHSRLVPRTQFADMVKAAKAEGRPEPFVYGSEAYYYEGSINDTEPNQCPIFERKQ